jgi:hypothetical protein
MPHQDGQVLSTAAGSSGVVGGSGTATFQPSPSLGASITINGKPFSIDGEYAGQITSVDRGYAIVDTFDAREYATGSVTTYNALFFNLTDTSFSIPPSITTPFRFEFPEEQSTGALWITTYSNDLGYMVNTRATLVPSSVTLSLANAVPEPRLGRLC